MVEREWREASDLRTSRIFLDAPAVIAATNVAGQVLRATNTGVTAIIDEHGRIVSRVPEFVTAVLEGEAQGRTGSTPYIVWGNWVFLGLAAGALLLPWRRWLPLAVGGIIVCATAMTSFLYGWLTSPLEPHHH